MTLPRDLGFKLVQVVQALEAAGIPYAVGGAIAYGFHADPRATQDIDIDIFVPPEEGATILEVLAPLGVAVSDLDQAREEIRKAGQIRTDFGGTYVDLFFAHHDFFERCQARALRRPFGRETISVLSAEDLTVFKALFNRPQDWFDIEKMMATRASTFELDYVVYWLGQTVGDDDSRINRVKDMWSRLNLPPADQP